jgi:hypothetical protein
VRLEPDARHIEDAGRVRKRDGGAETAVAHDPIFGHAAIGRVPRAGDVEACRDRVSAGLAAGFEKDKSPEIRNRPLSRPRAGDDLAFARELFCHHLVGPRVGIHDHFARHPLEIHERRRRGIANRRGAMIEHHIVFGAHP